MTAKQTSILDTATRMFADEGYDAVSTARIAKSAGVSEGLIFRHFGNKRGLLNAIIAEGNRRKTEQLDKFEEEQDPSTKILAIIDAAFKPSKADAPYSALRMQLTALGDTAFESAGESTEAILQKAFKQLGYEDPETEARFLRFSLEGIASAASNNELKKAKKLQEFVRAMYA